MLKGIEMSITQDIQDWKMYPNALGSEAQVTRIVESIAAKTGKSVPKEVELALKSLSLRGTMRSIASEIGRSDNAYSRFHGKSFRNDVDSLANSSGISWAEGIAVLSQYIDTYLATLD